MGALARRCRGCPAFVYDLKNERTGKLAPIDAEPSPTGNIVVNLELGTYRVVGWDRDQAPDAKHRNHFSTCPAAARFKPALQGGRR